MNTAIKPPPAAFSYIVDDVVKTPDSLTWLNDRVLRFRYSEALLDPSVVNLNFPAPHPLLRFATGMQHGSFLDIGFEFVPTAEASYANPELSIHITFPTDMDETVIPIASDFEIEVDEETQTIDDITWDSPTVLTLELTVEDVGGDIADITFATPTPRLRATDLHQACPFFLGNVPIPA